MIILLYSQLGFATETEKYFVYNKKILLVSKFEIRKVKTTAKGPHQENPEILTLRN